MSGEAQLYTALVRVTNRYLGPAAPRFISRQIRNHLRKDPDKLVQSDLDDLIHWLTAAMTMLTDDSALIHEYGQALVEIKNGKQR